MKEMGMHGEDLQGFDVFSNNQEVEVIVGKEDEEIWFETASQHHQNTIDAQNNNNHNKNNDKDDGISTNNNNNGMLDVDVSDPSSLFYAEFPPLPDFPCMSSSSSSSSNPAATKPFMTSTATSSSASTASSGTASWAVLKSDADHDPSSVSMDTVSQSNSNHQGGGVGKQEQQHEIVNLDDVDQCMDIMENFGCIDLLEGSDICWDPSPLFEDDHSHNHNHNHDHNQLLQQQSQSLLERNQRQTDEEEELVFQQFMVQGESTCTNTENNNNNNNNNNNTSACVEVGQGSGEIKAESSTSPADDLAMVFFEWLKSNKEMVSAEDLRNIKIKKSTIESAAKRLGGGKEGMKQLLKLILQWVQNHHLQSKRIMMVDDDIPNNNVSNDLGSNPNNSTVNANSNPNPDLNCMSPSTWITPPPPPFPTEVGAMVPVGGPQPTAGGFSPMVGYMGGDPYGSGYSSTIPGSEYHSWAPPTGSMQYGLGPYGPFPDPGFGGYGPGYPAGFYYHPGPGEGLMRMGSSATKEARKKRMARQRRFFTHHQRSHVNQNGGNHNHGGVNQQHQMVENVNCGVVAPHPGHGNWVYWPHPQPPQVPIPPPQVNVSVAGSGPVVGQMAPPPPERVGNGLQRQVGGGVEKKQGWKTEKNLRFLLQKVLKQSDVGSLGRIVLPKKEAETHLPELDARDGIPIAMEDIGTSRVWNMRYRFWPNNKSRMYLLENTGDFVRSNGLQEGDFIVIYSDVKCGKYMIRGVKVRPQQQGSKSETTCKNDKPNKTQKTLGSFSAAGTGPSSSPNIMQL